jgi:AAA+ superfamily predicted ATPase
MRKKLWEKMLLPTLPLATDINVEHLAKIEDVCGRDIKNAIIKSATKTAIDGRDIITNRILEESIQDIIAANKEVTQNKMSSFSDEKKKQIETTIKRKLRHKQVRRVKLQN